MKCARVTELTEQGNNVLHETTEEWVWILAGTGSSIHVANLDLHFAGAQLQSAGSGAVYASATGDPFVNQGSFSVDFDTEPGHQRQIKFLNGKVTIPIMSMRLWAKEGGTVASSMPTMARSSTSRLARQILCSSAKVCIS